MKRNNKNNKRNRKILLIIAFLLLGVAAVLVFFKVKDKKAEPTEMRYLEFVACLEEGRVESVDFDKSAPFIHFALTDDETVYKTDNPKLDEFKSELLLNDVTVNEVTLGEKSNLIVGDIVFLIVQYALIFIVFAFIFKKMQGGTEQMHIETTSNVDFSSVAGLDEVKESLMTVVDMLNNPGKYRTAGARVPKGVLLYGPPGTGKTLIAKAVAGEANVNFIAVNGADFEHKYVGVGADKVRKIFDRAKKESPCIVFIDELDAVGCKRSSSDKSYERQTLNQLLSCMDGFEAGDGVFIFAATNDPDALDPALLRPGRFDARYAVGLPETAKDREEIINLYAKDKKLGNDVSVSAFAKQVFGCSPAMIEVIMNEAAIESVKNGGVISKENLDDALYRQLMKGHKKKTTDRNLEEKNIVAWHEAGHAVVGYLQNEDVTKVSIVPTTSGAGGVTIFNQKKLGLYTKTELENKIKTLYAGRNAEILLRGKDNITTGASNDIKEATAYIKEMVAELGMSKYGMLSLSELGLDNEIIVEECCALSERLDRECRELLEKNRALLECVASELLEKETLDEADLRNIYIKFQYDLAYTQK